MGLLGPFVGRLYDKVGPRPLIIPAMVVVAAVLWAMTLLGADTWWPFILAGHIVMSLGFAFLFGPLFTTSLSSVQPQLYSHGSALLGSIQQVAGAAGVALFVALMSAQTAASPGRRRGQLDALAGGIRLAFTVGAVIAFLPSCLLPRQAPTGAGRRLAAGTDSSPDDEAKAGSDPGLRVSEEPCRIRGPSRDTGS